MAKGRQSNWKWGKPQRQRLLKTWAVHLSIWNTEDMTVGDRKDSVAIRMFKVKPSDKVLMGM